MYDLNNRNWEHKWNCFELYFVYLFVSFASTMHFEIVIDIVIWYVDVDWVLYNIFVFFLKRVLNIEIFFALRLLYYYCAFWFWDMNGQRKCSFCYGLCISKWTIDRFFESWISWRKIIWKGDNWKMKTIFAF